eukprot:c45549_g1_i1 orf=3-197(-)
MAVRSFQMEWRCIALHSAIADRVVLGTHTHRSRYIQIPGGTSTRNLKNRKKVSLSFCCSIFTIEG